MRSWKGRKLSRYFLTHRMSRSLAYRGYLAMADEPFESTQVIGTEAEA